MHGKKADCSVRMSNNNNKFFNKLVSKTKIYLIIILVLLVIICAIKPVLILPSLIVYILILIYTYWTNRKRMAEVSEHLMDLTFNVDKVSKRTLINSPFPLVIVETDGNIIWKSTKFVQEFGDMDIDEALEDLVKEIKLEIQNRENIKENKISSNILIGGKSYKVIGDYVRSKSTDKKKEYTASLYFIDETEIDNLKKEYENSKVCIGITMIDNYEEIIQRTSAEEQIKIFSEIEKKIYDWAAEFDSLVIKSERDTFVWICEQRYLELLQDNKFNILDTVRELCNLRNIQTTLSIAVSCDGESNYEKYKTAKKTIDIALGRGGDQAIVRKDDRYTFFGGRTQEIEKRTRVKARTFASALEELMLEADNVVVMGHTNSDIDSLGSGLGVYRFAKSLEKEAYIVNSTCGIGLENFLQYVKNDEEYKNAIVGKSEALDIVNSKTLLVIVDTHKKTYSDVPELIDMAGKIVIIDHHRMSTDFIENAVLTFQEVYASSAAELVTELLTYSDRNINLSTIEAEGLYGGIMMDTKNFTFKTGVRTFEAAAYLRKCGVDIIKVKKWFQSDLNTYNTIAEIVADSEIICDSIAISVYDKPDKDSNIICAKAADELLTISDINASFVIGDSGDQICISGRSLGNINVQVILEKLGGGGHITLAGAQISGKTVHEAKADLIEKIKEYFKEQ